MGGSCPSPTTVLVRFQPELPLEERERLVGVAGGMVTQTRGDLRILHVRDPEPTSPLRVVGELEQSAGIVYAEPNALERARHLQVPSDPLFHRQWYLSNTGSSLCRAGADISVLEAWELTTGSERVGICILDDGVDGRHPDLAENMSPGGTSMKETSTLLPLGKQARTTRTGLPWPAWQRRRPMAWV